MRRIARIAVSELKRFLSTNARVRNVLLVAYDEHMWGILSKAAELAS
ncbi:MAG TPA: hypothetical protein VGK88_05740 [bacterium]|jgi:O-acetyl-ADP-ribose deacetylase (regulator of RNase III)